MFFSKWCLFSKYHLLAFPLCSALVLLFTVICLYYFKVYSRMLIIHGQHFRHCVEVSFSIAAWPEGRKTQNMLTLDTLYIPLILVSAMYGYTCIYIVFAKSRITFLLIWWIRISIKKYIYIISVFKL